MFFLKGKRLFLALLALFLIALLLTFGLSLRLRSNRLHIAVLAPISGEYRADGQQMVAATQMYLDRINRAGGIDGRQVKLLVFDTQGKAGVAREKAKEIVADERVLIVLGTYFSQTAMAVGQIFKQGHLTAVTPTASYSKITEENNFYFRVSFDSKTQGVVLANYVKKILHQNKISIVADRSSLFSRDIANNFENTFQGIGGRVRSFWTIDDRAEDIDREIDTTAKKILATQAEGPKMLFLSLLPRQAARLIVSLKRQGSEYKFIGTGSLTEATFIEELNRFPEAQAQPGYFSDGIYAASPLIYDVAGEKAQNFKNTFIDSNTFAKWESEI